MLVISGLHLSIVAGFGFLVSKYIWRFYLHKKISQNSFSCIFTMLISYFYASIAGFSLATLRAMIMVFMVCIALLFKRNFRVIDFVIICLLFCLTLDPFNIIDYGFWLSFGAVFIISIYVINPPVRVIEKKENNLINKLKIQTIICVGMFGLTSLMFGKTSLIAPIANMIFIPIFSILLVLPILSGCLISFVSVDISKVFYAFSNIIYKNCLILVDIFSNFKSINLYVSPYQFLFLLIGSLILLLPKKVPGKHLAIFCFLPIFFPHLVNLNNGEVDFYVLDVGQGLSTLIKTKNHTVLYDTGPKIYNSNFEAGSKIILPFLQTLRIKKLDKVIVSHADLDHAGGYNAIRDNIAISETLTSQPRLLKFPNIKRCQKGQKFIYDDVKFEFLHPNNDLYKAKNDNSCVLKVTASNKIILLPGDITKIVEKSMVKEANYGTKIDYLKADIIVAPHHGSKNSSSINFVNAVYPKYAVFSAGFANKYGHPHRQAVDLYKKKGATLINIEECGTLSINIKMSGDIIKNCYKDYKFSFITY